MRRSVSIVFLLLIVGLSTAAPAFAQGRDPFEPQPGEDQQAVDPGDSERDPFNPEPGEAQDPALQEDPQDPTTPTVDPTTDPQPVTDPDPVAVDDDDTAPLANTGADVTTWGGIAYVLIAVGLAAIVAARTFAPVTTRRRR